jgi:hypothetical protein
VRKLVIALAAAAALVLTASAVAVLPQKGKFAGTTNAHGIAGFKDGVTFSVINGGKTLHDFTFGTLGCFGTGAFPVGVDPYALATSVGTVQTIPVGPKGTFLVTAKAHFADANDTTTTAVIQGTFSSAKAVKGTITITQTDTSKDKCGPSKLTFTAAPGVPDDSDEP